MLAPAASSAAAVHASTRHSALPAHRRDHDGEHQLLDDHRQTPLPRTSTRSRAVRLATSYFGVTTERAELCGEHRRSFFGSRTTTVLLHACAGQRPKLRWTTVNHTISAPNLADQLTAAGKTWKGYLQSLPPPGHGRDSRPARTRTAVHVQVPEQRQRPVRLQAQPVRELHGNAGRAVQHGSGHATGEGPDLRRPAELQLHRARPVPRHARHGLVPRTTG